MPWKALGLLEPLMEGETPALAKWGSERLCPGPQVTQQVVERAGREALQTEGKLGTMA